MSFPDSGLRYRLKHENDLFSFHCRVPIREQKGHLVCAQSPFGYKQFDAFQTNILEPTHAETYKPFSFSSLYLLLAR